MSKLLLTKRTTLMKKLVLESSLNSPKLSTSTNKIGSMLKPTLDKLKLKSLRPTNGSNGLMEDSLRSKERVKNSKTKDVSPTDSSSSLLRTTLMLLKLLSSSSLISVDTSPTDLAALLKSPHQLLLKDSPLTATSSTKMP